MVMVTILIVAIPILFAITSYGPSMSLLLVLTCILITTMMARYFVIPSLPVVIMTSFITRHAAIDVSVQVFLAILLG